MGESIERKLLPFQIPHVYQLYECLQENRCIVDASDTGTGKTYCSIGLCKLMRMKPFIICPKSVINSWRDVARLFDCEIYGISNYEKIKNGKHYTNDFELVDCPFIDVIRVHPNSKKAKDFVFHLPHDCMIIFDEAHRCKNDKTVNNRLLLATKNTVDAVKILLLSATISDKLDCFKSFGVVLKLFDDKKKFKRWARTEFARYEAELDHQIFDENQKILYAINKAMFPHRGSRIRIAELGDLFPRNNIIAQCYFCENTEQINAMYVLINQAMQELKDKATRAHALAKLNYARQQIELLKIPIFRDLIVEGLENNLSVVVFVNFRATMDHILHEFGSNCKICGGQKLEERDASIAYFQSNQTPLIVSMIQAGGVGISLHDIHGNHPRMSIISPTWSGQDMVQAFGRVHRAGGKTHSLQKIVYCAKTYEEEICRIIKEKIQNIKGINDGEINPVEFDTQNINLAQ